MTRIVTSTYRPKRPPRKPKAQAAAITGPAIVTAASRRARAIRRREEADDGQEASPEIKAFFARMMRRPDAGRSRSATGAATATGPDPEPRPRSVHRRDAA
jgi:hypothetical protein